LQYPGIESVKVWTGGATNSLPRLLYHGPVVQFLSDAFAKYIIFGKIFFCDPRFFNN
jgi:hypothetical protein